MSFSDTPLFARLVKNRVTEASTGSEARSQHVNGLEGALGAVLATIRGIDSVRVLRRAASVGSRRHKIFIVLKDHDVDRDGDIVDVMCQLDDIDYDLVPSEAVEMIPVEAVPFAIS